MRTNSDQGRDPVATVETRFYSNRIQKSAFNYDFLKSLQNETLKKLSYNEREPHQAFQQVQEVLRPKSKVKSLYRTNILLIVEPRTH